MYTDPIGSMLIESNSEKEIEVRKIIKERNQIFRHQLSVVSDGEYLQLRGEMVDNKVERDAGATNSKSSQHKADKSNNAEDPSQGDLESVRANSERLLNIAGYPNSARDQLQNVPEHQGTPSANSGPIHDKAERSNNGQNPLKEASEIFVRSLCKQREGALTPLGTLPDGRDVYFFGCDPEAIYVQAFAFDPIAYSVAEKKFRRITINRTNNERSPCLGKNSSSLCCVWGCTNEATGRCAEFYSETQLLDHIQSFHSWSESDVYRLGDSGRFSRISVRDKIMVDKFIACIKSAALARSSELMDTIVSHKTPPTIFEDPSGQRIICSPVPYTVALNVPRLLHVVQAHGHWSGGLSVFDLSSKLPESVQPMYLLMRLLLLRTHILETGIGEFDEVYSASATRLDGPDKLLEWNAPCCLSRQADGIKECALCALNSAEEVFRVDHGEQDPYQRVRGNPIGCAAAGSVLFSEYEAVAEHDNIPGDLGYAKRLLLGIAKNIPAALRFDWMQNKLSSMMWKDGGSKSFQRHILRSNSVSMLSQAFVVLLSSIKREKLPLWWQTEETGWCNPQRLLVSPTKASLTLNILLFDAALAEFIETGPEECKTLSTLAYTKKDLVPDSFLSLKPEERVDELLRCAERASIPRYDGDHDYFCTTCEEGGYLLCCEFCSTVVHKECCSPPFVEVPKYWVCGPCTVDIMNLSKAGTTS